jgi:putative membrane protein
MNKRAVEILWLAVLFALAAIMGVLLISGDIALYLAPRMYPIAWFGFAVLGILAIFQLVRLVRANRHAFGHTTRLYGLMFLIPIVLFLTTPPQAGTPQTLPNPNVDIIGAAQLADQTPIPDEAEETPPAQSAGENTPQAAEPMPESTEDAMPEAIVTDISTLAPCVRMDEAEEYVVDMFADSIYTSVSALEGQRITLHGFVYRDDQFPEDTLLVSRLLISCCVADASLVGFHVRVENADDFANDEWVDVTGIVAAFLFNYDGEDFTMPILTDGIIRPRKAPSPEDAYIYP